MRYVCIIFDIIRKEKLCRVENKFFDSENEIEELITKFMCYRFFLYHVESEFGDYISENEWINVTSRKEDIIDLPIIAESMCINPAEVLGKLSWKFYSEKNRSYHFIKPDNSKLKIEEFPKKIEELKNIFLILTSLNNDVFYCDSLKEDIKGIYQFIIEVDWYGYRLLIEDEKFHIAYYDVIFLNMNRELFMKRYEIWLTQMMALVN